MSLKAKLYLAIMVLASGALIIGVQIYKGLFHGQYKHCGKALCQEVKAGTFLYYVDMALYPLILFFCLAAIVLLVIRIAKLRN